MNEIQTKEQSLREDFETTAPIELKALLREWKGGVNAQSDAVQGRTVPRYFDRYFQTLPLGLN